ncbi:epoxide hydrolase family protein [Hoeflea sp.]|uniref:epoxide hydrolase family protein n=1 Tax=Hoeflea sp. TaxID=1940281 RepID=UPI0019A9438E|nr:epoxide hydrolase family protein [Hoeflea sp.]MBC7282707.1 epoxide hydrolase [Hoeflea sp.]
MTICKFELHVADADIEDLHFRLSRSRFPFASSAEPWELGADIAYMRDLTDYWQRTFDWRAQEQRLNSFPQFKLQLDDLELHFIHVHGPNPHARPLLLCHGWPGSIFEFLDIIPRLTDPERFGGSAEDAFTVIVPSLPGYGLSYQPGQKGFGVEEMADCFATLMRELNYDRYLVQGGDWGGFIASRMAYCYPDNVAGLHLNLVPVPRSGKASDRASADERAHFDRLELWLKDGVGYQWIQGTRPQTLSFGLMDSPLGLGAWIVEKFRAWSDCKGEIEGAISRDHLLANISLYWFTGAIGSSFYPYYARMHRPWPIPLDEKISVPMAYAEFPGEMVRPPRSLAEGLFSDIRRWTAMPRGGHFAALEQPELLAADIQAFAREIDA